MITLLTGPIQSGKTTYLQRLVQHRTDVGGFLTPDIDGQRYLLDLQTTRTYPLETGDSSDAVAVGSYQLSCTTLSLGVHLVDKAMRESAVTTIVIDEIGKLELQGAGYGSIIPAAVAWSREINHELILVVRDYLIAACWVHWLEGRI